MSRFPHTMIGWKARLLWGSFALDLWGAKIGKLISLFIIIAFSIGSTYFFRKVFEKLLELEVFGMSLLWRVVGIALGTLFGLLVVSNLITGIATLYRSSEVGFLMARPVSYRNIFINRFIDNIGYSSWSLAVLGVPMMVALGQVFNLSVYVICSLILFGFMPFVLIAAEIGVAALMGQIFLAKKTSPKFAILFVLTILASVIGWVVFERSQVMMLQGMPGQLAHIEHIASTMSGSDKLLLTPPQWLAGSMNAILKNDIRQIVLYTGLLILTAVVWLRWLWLWSGTVYYHSWISFSEMTGKSGMLSSAKSAARFTRGFLPNPINAMLRKDLLEFMRNPSQWAQFLILVAFLLIYLLNLVYISGKFIVEDEYWKTLVLFLNFAFTGFILATLSVRFVFPLISLEGKSFWVIRSAPVSVNTLFWEKFLLAFVVFMGLCEIIVYFSNHELNVTGPMISVTTAATFTMGVALTGLAIGMGALFPDFRNDSPMRIASTPGGVLTVVISLLYVGLMVAILAWPTQGYFHYLSGQGPLPFKRALQALTLVAGLNALVLLLPVSQGRQVLLNKDF